MVVNSARQTLKCLALKAPGFGNERSEMLKDMSALTGGVVFGGIGKEKYLSGQLFFGYRF